MDRNSPSTATQADSGGNKGRNIGRRAFVYGVGASAAGAGALSLDSGPVQESEAIAPVLLAGAVGIAAGAAGGIAFGATFGGPDDAQVASSLEWQSHVDEFTRAREDELMIDQTTASLKRDVQLVENKAREQAIFKIYEAGVDGLSQSDATTAAQEAIDDAYAVVERAILTSWNTRFARLKNVVKLFHGSSPSYMADAPELLQTSSTGDITTSALMSYNSISTTTHTLLDGSTLDYEGLTSTQDQFSPTYQAQLDPVAYDTSVTGEIADQIRIKKPDPANYSTVGPDDALDITVSDALVIDASRWGPLLSDLFTAHTNLQSEVSSMVSSYYQPAKDGKISLNEAVGPKYLTDSAKTAKDFEEAAQALRSMGYPISNQKVTVELPTESGGTMEVIGRLAWTAHNGNGLVVGQTLNFQNFPGSLMAAVNTPEGQRDSSTDYPGAEQIEITGEFTITTAEGADEVTFADRSLAEADATTNEEINKIYKENYDANKEATSKVHDTATSGSSVGGGGGFLGGFEGSSNLGILAAGGAVLVYLLGNNN